jgi:cation diffusion facilitator CzcD-associated flavoprotein CzcO
VVLSLEVQVRQCRARRQWRHVPSQSDARPKTDIALIDNAMERIGAISGYTCRMTDDETGRRRQGVLAQQVMAVMPEAVVTPPTTDPDGFMSVAYGNLVALMIEGLKELGARVDRLEG